MKRAALLVVVLLCGLGMNTASAMNQTCSTSSWDAVSMCPDEGAAAMAANQTSSQRAHELMNGGGYRPGTVSFRVTHVKEGAYFRGATIFVSDPSVEWDIIYRYYPRDKTCSTRPPSSGGFYLAGEQSSCSEGCRYDKGNVVDTMKIGGKSYFQNSGAKPTGDICIYDASKDDTPVTEDQCQQAGTLTQCVTKDGKHCAIASTGKKFCWKPAETGTKVSGNEAATKVPQGAEVTAPPKPPADGGEWQNSGSGSMSGGSGTTTSNFDITGWNSNGDGKGSGESGGNDGGGDGNGKGDGDGQGDNPGAGIGDLYKGTDKTVAGLMGSFYAQASNAPVMKGLTNFMSINSNGGSCPVFTLPASEYWKSMTFDAHCSGTWLQMLQAMGWIVLAIAAYIAVRIAVT